MRILLNFGSEALFIRWPYWRYNVSGVLHDVRNVFKRCNWPCKHCSSSPRVFIMAHSYLLLYLNWRNLRFFPKYLLKAWNLWFWVVFGTQNSRRTQLQTLVENFLEVETPQHEYSEVSTGHKLSNAPTLMSIRRLERSQTILVQKVFFNS